MAVAEGNQNIGTGVVKLQQRVKGESLWLDAWRRLRRNRLAVLGAIIIILNILMAIFAAQLAPQEFKTQVLADNNAAPLWVTRLFPNMVPKEDGGYVSINVGTASGVAPGMQFVIYRSGQYVGDLQVENVRPKEAGGKVTLVRSGQQIQKGDRVVAGLEGR